MRSRPRKKPKRVSTMPTRLGRISSWGCTDLGRKREINEDRYLLDSNLDLYIVADGMGGHAGGDTAARMAVEVIREKVLLARQAGDLFNRQAVEQESSAILELIDVAIRAASDRIFRASHDRPELAGMGTTVTLMLLHGRRAYVAHVGDSRLYLLRDGVFRQMTEDHSLVNEQVKAGYLTAEEAQHSRFRNIITRSVGFESEVASDTFSWIMRPTDVFLLCSDGLTGMVADKDIQQLIRYNRLCDAPAQLVALANHHGGEDNITLILIRYNGSRSSTRRGKYQRQKRLGKERAHDGATQEQ